MIKLIALDLDGTVLTSENEVTGATIQAVQAAHKQGVHVVVSTGRNYSNAKHVIDKLGVCELVSVCNGALVLDLMKSRTIYRNSINAQDIRTILPMLDIPEIFYQLYIGGENYRDERLDKLYFDYFPRRPDSDRVAHVVPNIREFVFHSAPGTDVCVDKIFVHCPNTELLGKLRKTVSQVKTVHLTSSNPQNFEVTNWGITKAVGIKRLCSYLGMTKEHVLAIGDSENDLDMLQYAGISVAMGNAIDSVKQCTDYITRSNDEDGVAYAIRHFLSL